MRDTGEKDAWIEQLAAAIAHYVASHPNASDTIEGIHRWWLMNDSLEDDPSVVDSALERLVQRGVMTKRVLPDGKAVFSGRVPGVRPGPDSAPRSDEEPR